MITRCHRSPRENSNDDPKKTQELKALKYNDVYWTSVIPMRSAQSRLPAAMGDHIRKALDTTVRIDFAQATPKEVLDYLYQQMIAEIRWRDSAIYAPYGPYYPGGSGFGFGFGFGRGRF